MTEKKCMEMIQREIESRKEFLKTLTNPKYIEDCKRDIEQLEKMLTYIKLD